MVYEGVYVTEQKEPYTLPSDRIVVKQDGSWSIEVSPREGCVIINATDYHAGTLRLSPDQLRKMLRMLRRKNRDRRMSLKSRRTS